MITRLWFVLCLAWAALLLIVLFSSPTLEIYPVHALLILGPFILGLIVKRAGKYIVTGQ